MAQIIKYQQGGSTSKKYGTFTLDGTKYDVDDDFISQLHQYGNTLRVDVGNQFDKIIGALKKGENLEFTSSGDGTIYGDIEFDLSNKQSRRIQNSRSGVGRRFGRLVHGKEQDAREAISALKDFKYNAPAPKRNVYDWSNPIKIEYQKDKDGKYTIENGHKIFIKGATNLSAIKALQDLVNIQYYKDTDEFKGYNGLTKKDYINMYNAYGEEGIKKLQDDIRNGTWSETDRRALAQIGLLIDAEPTDEEIKKAREALIDPEELAKQEAEQKARARYQKARVNYNYKNIFGVDENGYVTIVDPKLQQIIGSGDAWLNDNFLKHHGEYSQYIPKGSGLFIIGGRVYKGDDQNSLRGIGKYLDFVADNRKTGGNATEIKQYWGENEFSGWKDLGYDSSNNRVYSPIFNAGDFGKDMSGYYQRETNSPLIFKYYPGYNANNDELFDVYGHPLEDKATTVYINPITKQQINPNDSRYSDYINNLKSQNNDEVINNYYENSPYTAFSEYVNFPVIGDMARVVIGGSPTNPNTGYTLYKKPGTNMYYWHDENPGGDDYILNNKLPSGEDKMRQYAWSIDPELGTYLENNRDILDNQEVRNLINDFIRNPYTNRRGTRRTISGDYHELWSKYPELAKIIQYIEAAGPTLGYGTSRKRYPYHGDNININEELRSITTPEDLQARGLAFRYPLNTPSYKQGGVLKLQGGGGVSASRANTIKASKDNIQVPNKKMRQAGEEKVIGDRTDLNTADKAELAALVADAASLGATFVPVYGNVAGAITGAAGSLTGFAADVAKDGLDWGDAGNLALNLGLDVATLIPGFGTVAKAAKVAKSIKRSKAVAKFIAKAVSGGAAVSGLLSAWNSLQDGKWTISDLRTILNGIRGVANISRLKGSAKKDNVIGNTVTLKPKSKDLPDIKLTRSEIESIESVSKNTRGEKLEELLISKLPKDTKTDDIKDILSEYDINRKGTTKWTWRHPFSVDRGNTVNTRKFKYDEISGDYRNPNDIHWYSWNRRAAIRDAKTNPDNPYFRPLHWDSHKVGDLNSIHPITVPIYSNLAPDLGITSNRPEQISYYTINSRPVFYKSGGRILKAELGTQLPFITSAQKEAKRRVQENKLTGVDPNKEINPILLHSDPTQGIMPTTTYLPNFSTNPLDKQVKEAEVNKEHQKTVNPGNYNVSPRDLSKNTSDLGPGMVGDYHTKGNGWKPNPDMFLGLSDYIVSAIGVNRQANKMKDAIRKGMIGSQQQMPTEYYPRFSDNGLFRMYEDRINNIRQYKNISSDPNATAAERYMREMSADQLTNDRNTKFSQIIGQYNDKMLGLKQQYANMRTQITNENKNRWYQGLAQLDMVDANKIAQRTQSAKNLIYQFRQDLAKDQYEKQQAMSMSNKLKLQNALNAELRSKFGHLFTPEMQEKYGTFDNFLNNSSEMSQHSYEIRDILNKHMANAGIQNYNQSMSHTWWGRGQIPYNKSGGYIKRHREVGEQHYLDQQKAITKSINDLNNNIIKLFIKMMS